VIFVGFVNFVRTGLKNPIARFYSEDFSQSSQRRNPVAICSDKSRRLISAIF
jgi:hypothetical protein